MVVFYLIFIHKWIFSAKSSGFFDADVNVIIVPYTVLSLNTSLLIVQGVFKTCIRSKLKSRFFGIMQEWKYPALQILPFFFFLLMCFYHCLYIDYTYKWNILHNYTENQNILLLPTDLFSPTVLSRLLVSHRIEIEEFY